MVVVDIDGSGCDDRAVGEDYDAGGMKRIVGECYDGGDYNDGGYDR